MQRQRRTRVLVSALFAAVTGLAPAGAAVAAEPPQEISPGVTGDYDEGRGFASCPENTYCLYDDPDFNADDGHARYWWLRGSVGDLGELPGGGFLNDTASVVNRTGGPIYLFSDHFDGNCFRVDAHTMVRDLSRYEFDDTTSEGVNSVSAHSSVTCENPIS